MLATHTLQPLDPCVRACACACAGARVRTRVQVCGVAGGSIERLLDAHSFLRVMRKGVVPTHDKVEGAAAQLLSDELLHPEDYEER